MARHGENIYKRADGRYEGRYVVGKTADGRTKFGYVYGYHYADVRRALLERKAEQLQRSKSAAPPCRWTLAQWLGYFMERELKNSVKPSSYQVYLNQVNRHLLPELGARRLSDLTPEVLEGFVRREEAAGLARSTIKGEYRLLTASLRFAQDEGLIRKNPCRSIRFRQSEAPEQRVLTPGERKRVKNAVSTDGLPAQLGLYTGMRLGELCALKWADIDWERRTVTVRRTAQRVVGLGGDAGKTMLMIGAPKSKQSCRVLPVADFLLRRLRQLFEARRDAEYVFGTRAHAAEPRTMQRRFKRFAARLGIENVHFHSLRHSFASGLLELGVDVKTVSALLGHASAKMTLDFYAHSLPEQQRQAIDKLSA